MSPREDGSIRVLIVDDDGLVRAGLKMVLEAADGIEVVGEATDGVDALMSVRELSPDIVLMDVRMPRRDGIASTRDIVAQGSETHVIVLTTFDADGMVVKALRAGASGFLLKDTRPEDIVDGIRKVYRGEPQLSPAAMVQLIDAVSAVSDDARRAQARELVESLSERERSVAVAIGQGKTNAEIAEDLYLSVATVKSYVTRLMGKLGAENRVQIAIRMHDCGMA